MSLLGLDFLLIFYSHLKNNEFGHDNEHHRLEDSIEGEVWQHRENEQKECFPMSNHRNQF